MLRALLRTGLLLMIALVLMTAGLHALASNYPFPLDGASYPYDTVVLITTPSGTGSGVVVEHTLEGGMCRTDIITAKHIVESGRTRDGVEPILFIAQSYIALVARESPKWDIALLTVDSKRCIGTPVNFTSKLELPSRVFSIGYPYGVYLIKEGIVSGFYDFFIPLGEEADGPWIVHSADLGEGSSGGGLFDEGGWFLGMNVAGLEHITVAMPYTTIKEFLDG
ncbi:hypothetical protein LCGC14_2059590 [marine sediment metagenome]|uniref:Serine protease n=1 Tax=marine sediment metagenome TaxID=412755 RepID=A0A0F9HIK0_9ZZZZ